MKKRFLSSLLAACMIFTQMPTSVMGVEFSDGEAYIGVTSALDMGVEGAGTEDVGIEENGLVETSAEEAVTEETFSNFTSTENAGGVLTEEFTDAEGGECLGVERMGSMLIGNH